MPLSKEDIKRLLAKPEPKKTAAGKKVDASVRTYETWFALNHKLFDDDKMERTRCSNPECPQPERICVEISGQWVCRICFLDGYLLVVEV